MGIYIGLTACILINGLISGKHRQWFIVSSFAALVIVAALRDESVGVDLALHYMRNFKMMADCSWHDAVKYFVGIGRYDIGFVFICKLIGMVSDHGQFFIGMTSLMIYGSLGRFIYKYSSDIVLDTLLIITSYTYFQYMCIIAQGLAVALILWGVDYLYEKKYVKFVCVVLAAATIHMTALITLIMIPLQIIRFKRRNALWLLGTMIAGIMCYRALAPVIVNTLFKSYAFYLGHKRHGLSVGLGAVGLSYLLLYGLCISYGLICLYGGRKDKNQRASNDELGFLVYMAICAFFFYAAGLQIEVSRRLMYYFSPFAYLTLGNALQEMSHRKMSRILQLMIYIITIMCFILLGAKMGGSGARTVPYQFYWQ